jgi:VCBS repeat-containing protein
VNITITTDNDAPVAGDATGTTAEDTASAPIAVTYSDNEDANTALVVTTSGTATNGGTVVYNGDATFTYTPPANFFGTDTFTYTVTDTGGKAATGTVTVTITSVNDLPVIAALAPSGNEDTAQTINVWNAVSDVEDGDAALTITASAPSNGGTLTNNGDGTWTYMPLANFNGDDTFTLTVTDTDGGTATATITITVVPVNDAPIAANHQFAVDEGETLFVGPTDVNNLVRLGVDVDGDVLTASVVTGPANGSVTINADGSFNYQHDGSPTTTDSFTYKLNDGTVDSNTGTITLAVTAQNDTPVAVDDGPYAVDEGGTVTVPAPGVLANDSDEESVIVAQKVTDGTYGTVTMSSNGSFTYVHNGNNSATSDSFTYKVVDTAGAEALATVSIAITLLNDTPIAGNLAATTAEDTAATIDASGAISDAEDAFASLIVVPSASANGGTVTYAGGSFTYTPALDFNGTDTFTYSVTDLEGASASGTVTVTVTAVNDAPVVGLVADQTVAEDGSITVDISGAVSDVDDAFASLTVAGAAGNGTVTYSSPNITYTPDADYNGADAVTFTVTDASGASATGGFLVTVTPVNDAPVVGAIADQAITDDQDALATVVATDADLDPLTYTLSPATDNASVDANGNFVFSPAGWVQPVDAFGNATAPGSYQFGDFPFTISVGDGTTTTDVSFTISVTPKYARCNVDGLSPLGQDVTSNDAVHVLKYIVRDPAPQWALTDSQLFAADCDGDGYITGADATRILQISAGIPVPVVPAFKAADSQSAALALGSIEFGSVTSEAGLYRVPVMLSEDGARLTALELSITADPSVATIESVSGAEGVANWLIADRTTSTDVSIAMAGMTDAVPGELVVLFVRTDNPESLKGAIRASARMNAGQVIQLDAIENIVPTEYALSQNYPNPFNPTTNIRYELPEATQVQVAIYDVQGRLVQLLVDLEQRAGSYDVQWDGRNMSNAAVASGVYIYQIRAGSFVSTKRMVLVK